MSDLVSKLTEKGYEYDFFQAVNLLEEYFQKTEGDSDPIQSGRINFVSDPSLTFPPGDITSIKKGGNNTIQFLLSFMGLLGISSPLPYYFTQYGTLHERDDNGCALADFLAMFNNRLYVLFYRSWKKYRLSNSSLPNDTFGLLKNIALLSGLTENQLKGKRKLLSYSGIFAGASRSAEGLKTIISNYFDDIPVSIKEWQLRWAPVKDLKEVGKDSILGINSMIGTHIRDYGGKFNVILGPLKKVRFETFLPGKKNLELLKDIITSYTTEPLKFDIEVKLKHEELTPVILGSTNAPLGITSSCGKPRGLSNDYSITINN